MNTCNYRLLVQYDGTDYSGWQIQRRGRTVQGTLQAAVEGIAREPIHLVGSGRTDAGVHARGQVASFSTRLKLAPEIWVRALNAALPADIRVRRASRVPQDFHAIRSAIAKCYRYHIYTGPVVPPWEARYCLHWPRKLDLEAMNQAASMVVGSHDMRSFAASGTTVRSFVRHVTASRFQGTGRRLVYTIEADGFLQHMVRSLVGTLLEVGTGRFSPQEFGRILGSRDRRKGGRTAPPQGLFLERVRYGRVVRGAGLRKTEPEGS